MIIIILNRFKMHLPTIVAVLFTIGILIGSFVWFSDHTDEMIESTTEFYLETNARTQAAAFYNKLHNNIELLNTLARSWRNVDMNNPDAIMQAIRQVEVFEGFQRIAVAGPDAHMYDTTGKHVGNVASTTYFKRAMEGKTTIADMVLYDSKMGEHLYIAVPVLQNDKPVGVIYGQFPLATLSSLIEAVGFQETSTSLLLSGDGTILARSATNELVTDRIVNFFDLASSWGLNGNMHVIDIKVDILNGKTITVPYQTGSRERLAIMTPVGLNNWYYAIVISQDLIQHQSDQLAYNMLLVEAMISVAFVFLFITLLHLLRQNAVIERTNDRFKMVNMQSHAIVVDYDYIKHQVELNGNTIFIESDAKDNYSDDELLEKARELLHENDVSVMQDFIDLASSNTTTLHREMRVLCADGNYYWYRFTGTVIRGAGGELLRLVGNFVNVEDEVSKQIQLKQKAEIDPLSGLLNKGAFTGYVSDVLAKADSDRNVYAFYIIDLDNFKKVNDTLGHIVGDRVITDVAKKLCTVFSENDYVGRIGGDEFTAFLKLSGEGIQISHKIITAKAQNLCNIINEIYSDGKNEVNITASIGVAVYPANGKTFNELYKAADKVLYKSKNGGKNRFTICRQ